MDDYGQGGGAHPSVWYGCASGGAFFRRVASCRVALRCVASRRVASRRVVLCRVASCRVRRCSLREPPAAKHGSTSLRLSGRAGGASGGCSSPFCLVLPCRVALRPVLSCRVALRCVRRCSLWEPPAAKHGSTSLRLSGRTEGASGGCSSPFCSVLSWNASNNFSNFSILLSGTFRRRYG